MSDARTSRLLIVHHSPTPLTQRLLDAVVVGAGDDAIEGVTVDVRSALEVTSVDLLDADGFLLGTSANFGYMSGALKHFFDSSSACVRGGSLDPATRGQREDVTTRL